MYVGRDMTELTMMSKTDWKDSELMFYHHSLQQVVPYLNAEGQSLHREIIEEIEARGGLNQHDADYTHGTRVSYD
ncbi:hypothetical protein PY093_04245 [Cytobacillus sp. S13-E01]|uniref:hypothetical protein n=1 Tax=Cytobacillus sp. S13-E01 TaxID=3031326 RepID=UPI0023D7C6AB|nr:hypothetical protein [Cytobacillus sp. S13-E01]MDF0725923.1 hypothetical protein [Cytobacillus sp. S13-E01]